MFEYIHKLINKAIALLINETYLENIYEHIHTIYNLQRDIKL
jgi:hypothetical protein